MSQRLGKAEPLILELRGCRAEQASVAGVGDEELMLMVPPKHGSNKLNATLFITSDADELFQLKKCVVEIYDRRIRKIENKLKDL